MPELACLPEWTETPEKRGLDPLGMQNSGIVLYQQLMPGVSNVTLRMRYYGFYCWLTDLYARERGSTALTDWRRWIRRGEALFALAAAKKSGDAAAGVGGVEWALETLAGAEDPIDFRAAAEEKKAGQDNRVYLAQPLGVFGGAYATQMAEAGFLELGQHHAFYKPTPTIGADAAAAFSQAIGGEAAAILARGVEDGVVTRAELAALASVTPDAIVPGSVECDLYRDVLFARRDDLAESALSRRDTLLLILRVARDLERRPTVEDLRWALFEPSGGDDSLAAQRLRWEAYQAQDLFQVGAAGLLRWSLDRLRVRPDGAPLRELLDLCVAPLLPALPGATWRALVERISSASADLKDLARRAAAIRADERMSADQAIAALSLIATLDARLRARGDLEAEVAAAFKLGDGFRSIASERTFLVARDDEPLADTLRRFLEERILNRHARVALRKLRAQRDYTYLFEIEDGRFRWRASYAPVFTTPRLAPALTFLSDIGLIDGAGLTGAGRALLDAP